MFHILVWSYDFQKNFGANHKLSTSPKIPDFQNGGKSPWRPISYVGSKFKCLKLIYHCEGNFIRINIVFRTRVQKWTYFELLTENQTDMLLKVVAFYLKIAKIIKNPWITKGIKKLSKRKQKLYEKFLKTEIKNEKLYKSYKSLFESVK